MTNLAINDVGDVLEFDGQQWKPARMAANDAGEKVVFDGTAWKPLGALTAGPKGQADARNTSDATAQAFGQGATLNFGDELTAGVRAAAPGLSNFMMRGPALQRDESIGGSPTPQTVSTAPTFQGRYDEELARERAKAKQFQKDSPVLSTGANIAGGVASTAAALPAFATAAAPTMLGNIGKMGVTGAALGGAAGAGEGEGTDDRLAKALLGAGVGGVAGGAAPIVGAGVRAAMETAPGRFLSEKVAAPVIRTVASLLGQPTVGKSLSAAAADGGNFLPPTGLQGVADRASNVAETGAVDRIATALQRAKLDPSQVERRLGQLGEGAMLADTDPQFLGMARGAKVMPGATRTHAENVLTARDRDAGNRLVSTFEGSEPPPSTFDLAKGFDANRSAVGADVYGTMRGEKLKLSAEMQDLLKTPAIKDAVAQIEADAASTGTQLTPIEIAHRVKQKLNDVAEAAFASGKPINKADLRSLAGRWEAAFGEANPTARAADVAYAQAASLPEYMGAGRNFLRRGTSDAATEASAPALGDLLASATTKQQPIAARAGATNAARETALEGTRPARSLAQRIDESTPVRDKIVQLFGPKQGSQIMQRAASETTFAKTSNDILRGSQTAEKTVDALDLGGTKIRASASGVTGNVIERIGDLITKMTGPNEAVRDAIGRATLNPDSAESRRLLALAAALLQRRAQGAPITAAASEIAGSQAGRQ